MSERPSIDSRGPTIDVTASREGMGGADDMATDVLDHPPRGAGAPRSETPAQIGRYTLMECLGSGGAGVVYRGHDPQLGRDVAIKLLRTDQQGSSWQERMVREAQAMAKIEHPNVVEVYDVGTERAGAGETIYIVMELIDGEDLRSWLHGGRSWRESLDVYRQAARGLAAAHACGLIHRDFKPGNAMIGRQGRVRVLDFGLVRGDDNFDADTTLQRSEQPIDTLYWGRTMTGGIVGTPPYMAPEQHDGRGVDARVDQFSLCVSLFEALYGERPFSEPDLEGLRQAKAAGRMIDVDLGSVPASLDAVVRRGLRPDPDERFESMQALADALDQCAARPRRWPWVAIAAAVALGMVGWWSSSRGSVPIPCAEGRDFQAWTAKRGAAIERAFDAASGALGGEVAQRVATMVRKRDARAQQTWDEACRQPGVSPARIEAVEQCLDERRAEADGLLEALGRASSQQVASALSSVHGLSTPEPCLDPSSSTTVPDPHRRALSTALARVEGLYRAGLVSEAIEQTEVLLVDAQAIGFSQIEARLRWRLGMMLLDDGDDSRAIDQLEQAALLGSSHRDHATSVAAWATLAQLFVLKREHHGDADNALRHAEAAAAVVPDDLAAQQHLWSVRGTVALSEGRNSDALQAYRQEHRLAEQIHGEGSGPTGVTHGHIATTLRRMGRLEDAEQELRVGIEATTAAYGSIYPGLYGMRGNLGNVLFDLGRRQAALEQFQQALAVLDGVSERDSQRRVKILNRIAATQVILGQLEQAGPTYEQSLEILERADAMGSTAAAETQHLYGLLCTEQGRHADAARRYEAALAVHRERGDQNRLVQSSLTNLAQTYVELGRLDEAEQRAREALALARGTFAEDRLVRSLAEARLGSVLHHRERFAEALEHLTLAEQLQQQANAPVHARAQLTLSLARTRVALGESKQDVRITVERALAEAQAMEEVDAKLVERLERWLEQDE